MKKITSLALVLVLVLSLTGCYEVIEAPLDPLSDGQVTTGAPQSITAKALSQKVTDPKADIPKMVDRKTGVNLLSNAKAAVEASNANEGYIDIKYTGGKKVTIMVQIYLNNSENKYNFNLNNAGNYETFALTEGNGKYTVRILENTSGNKYACVYSCEINVTLRSELLPFLYSNNTVNYAAAPNSVKKAAELTKDCKDEFEKIGAIYTYVVQNTKYDYDLANKIVAGTVSGHIPNLDATLASKKGICFDYAALMSGMLRSQGIPCRLVKGYAGTTYHAWINVFVKGVGWVDKVIQFDGTSWTMMDPTFVSSSGDGKAIENFVGKGNAYTPKQLY